MKKLAMMLSVGLIAVMTTVMLTACGSSAGGAITANQVNFRLDQEGYAYSALPTATHTYATGVFSVNRPEGRHLAIDLTRLFDNNAGLRGANLKFEHAAGTADAVEGVVRTQNAEGVWQGTAAAAGERTLWLYNDGTVVTWLRSDNLGTAAPAGTVQHFTITGHNGVVFTISVKPVVA